jgi:ankyrin repeat protein
MVGGKYKKIRHALHWAARNGRVEVCEWLIREKHVDVNIEADDGTVPVHFAVWTNNIEMVKWLVEVIDCDLHKLNAYGCNASQWGALNGDVAMLRLLQGYGLNLGLLNLNGHSAIHKAAVNGRLEACQWLLGQHTPQKDDIACEGGNDDVIGSVGAALEQSLKLSAIDDGSDSSGSDSSGSGDRNKYSGDKSARGRGGGGLSAAVHMRADKSGNTPAMIARNNGHTETSEWLESYCQELAVGRGGSGCGDSGTAVMDTGSSRASCLKEEEEDGGDVLD